MNEPRLCDWHATSFWPGTGPHVLWLDAWHLFNKFVWQLTRLALTFPPRRQTKHTKQFVTAIPDALLYCKMWLWARGCWAGHRWESHSLCFKSFKQERMHDFVSLCGPAMKGIDSTPLHCRYAKWCKMDGGGQRKWNRLGLRNMFHTL